MSADRTIILHLTLMGCGFQMTRNAMLASGIGGAVVVAAFAFGFFSPDEAGGPTALVAADAPTIKVYKSPT